MTTAIATTRAVERVVESQLAPLYLGSARAVVESLVDGVRAVDLQIATVAALAFAHDAGRDPASTDELTPSIFATPFRDRVTGSPLAFRRDEHGKLVPDGPLVELGRELQQVQEESPRR